jgi:hypothetical protein
MPRMENGRDQVSRLCLRRSVMSARAADRQSDEARGYVERMRATEADLHHRAYVRVRLRGGDPDERLIGHGPFGWFDVARLVAPTRRRYVRRLGCLGPQHQGNDPSIMGSSLGDVR